MTRKSEAQKADEAKTHVIDVEIGLRLSRFRRIARLTQEEMAEAMDVPLRMWRGYEEGERIPASRLYLVCKRLGREPNEILQGLPDGAVQGVGVPNGVQENAVAFTGPNPLEAALTDLARRAAPLDPLTANLIFASVRGQLELVEKGAVRRPSVSPLNGGEN